MDAAAIGGRQARRRVRQRARLAGLGGSSDRRDRDAEMASEYEIGKWGCGLRVNDSVIIGN